MLEFSLPLPTEAATAALGAKLAPALRPGDVIALSGPLGAGKTALARALIAVLTGKDDAPSPTFTLVETYETPDFPLHHFDLYRLEKAEDVWELGFEDALDGVVVIEWPERIERLIPPTALLIRLSMDGMARRALVRGQDQWTQKLSGLNPD
jgi:tRNA threonylcarbamoyladenosine biosynthesis protein TsaE